MGADHGSTGFGCDVGHGHVFADANIADIGDHIPGILCHRVVHGALEIRAGAIVVDTQTSADVDDPHGESHFFELAVKAGRLHHGIFDGEDIGDLRANVEVEQSQTAGESGFLQLFGGE